MSNNNNNNCECDLPRVPTWSANCAAARSDLALCQVKRLFAEQSLGRVALTFTVDANTSVSALLVRFPGFAASAGLCLRAITLRDTEGNAYPVDIARLAAVRLYEEPDGSWVWARDNWTSEQVSLFQATTGRCACECACAGCIPPDGGWALRLEFPTIAPGVDPQGFVLTVEYRATMQAPCCTVTRRCGEPQLDPTAEPVVNVILD